MINKELLIDQLAEAIDVVVADHIIQFAFDDTIAANAVFSDVIQDRMRAFWYSDLSIDVMTEVINHLKTPPAE